MDKKLSAEEQALIAKLEEDFLQQYFEICKRTYEQMERDGTWPWESDSPNFENLIDSEDNPETS
ncbi:hypothetical protein [Parasphingorhabdus halotolerans]|uniref:Uncharacterized protein n=1 Tax=Parasphingorhabdus halotolerans TaxID=2725558 RepID=A0A6H2DQC1_9SPHN|nr:hypothetical protein [Parasphingorhabdus halotolerans]QJB69866.1 hypothetical protein HF685_11735 [Parasphingorhabdus halotolerans]